MTHADLCIAVAGIAKVMAGSHEAHAELIPAFTILAEALAECSNSGSSRKQQPTRKQELIERLAQIESRLHERSPAARARIVMSDLGIGRSRYFELRAAAIEQRLLSSSPVSPEKIPDCRTASGLALIPP